MRKWLFLRLRKAPPCPKEKHTWQGEKGEADQRQLFMEPLIKDLLHELERPRSERERLCRAPEDAS